MTGILADYQYTLNDFKRVSLNLDMNHDLSDETIKIVNELASLVGAPTYKRTPVFAKPIMRRERPRRNKVTITASDWEEMRNFKVTELKKNEDGIEKKIDDIRNLLNKITSKNYDNIKTNITDILNNIISSDVNKDELLKVGESIFEIGCMNKFWCKLYASLYKELLVSFPIMKDICTQNFNSFSELFENIRYVSEEDYDEFCLINKENSKRRALSSFFVHLMKEGVIEASNIAEIIIKLTDKFIEYINTDNMKNQVDEICENLFILIKEGIDDIETESTLEESYDKICTFVTDVSNFKPREYKSLTSKTLFKFMDLIEYC
jgi:hypothetical protein